MANGKRGDHPVSDICGYGLPIYSSRADQLVRELAKLVPEYRMWELFDWFNPPPLAEFERQLGAKRDALREEARQRGWEVEE